MNPKSIVAAAVAATVLFASCSSGGGGSASIPAPPPATNPDAEAINALLASISDPTEVPERTGPAVETGRRREGGFEVISYTRSYSHNGQLYPILSPHLDVIYPGADVQGNSLPQGIPSPITLPRGPGSIAISNVTGSALPSVNLPEVGMAQVTTAMNQIIATQPEQFPARLQVSIQRVRNSEELQIDVGASASYLGVFEGRAGFQFDSRSNNTAMLVTLQQDFYSIAFERPSSPDQFFAQTVTAAQLATQVGPGNPAAYISEVTYGRVFYLLIQATASEETMQATLEANLNLGVFGGGASGGVHYLTSFQGLEISAYAYGGGQQEVLDSILGGLDSWRNFKNLLVSSNHLGLAQPTSYSVRSLATDTMLKNAVNADYGYEVRTDLPPEVPSLISPVNAAVLDNGCAIDPNPVDWDFDWSDTPSTDRYALEINNSDSGMFVQTEVQGSSYHHHSVGVLRPSGWSWRVRAHANGVWQPWSETRGFGLRQPNSDCLTGVRFWSRTGYTGTSLFIEASPAAVSGIDFELISGGMDDDVDSIELFNIRGVRLYENPLRAPWYGAGGSMFFTQSSPDLRNQGFPINSASAFRMDLGMPF